MTELLETQINKDLNGITRALYAQFPEEMEKMMTVSGVNLRFIPVSEVINRLNKVLGIDSWSFEVIRLERDTHEPDEIIAHINLSVDIAGKHVVKHGVGGTSIKRIKSTGKPVDLGNSFKMAVSDALKRQPNNWVSVCICLVLPTQLTQKKQWRPHKTRNSM